MSGSDDADRHERPQPGAGEQPPPGQTPPSFGLSGPTPAGPAGPAPDAPGQPGVPGWTPGPLPGGSEWAAETRPQPRIEADWNPTGEQIMGFPPSAPPAAKDAGEPLDGRIIPPSYIPPAPPQHVSQLDALAAELDRLEAGEPAQQPNQAPAGGAAPWLQPTAAAQPPQSPGPQSPGPQDQWRVETVRQELPLAAPVSLVLPEAPPSPSTGDQPATPPVTPHPGQAETRQELLPAVGAWQGQDAAWWNQEPPQRLDGDTPQPQQQWQQPEWQQPDPPTATETPGGTGRGRRSLLAGGAVAGVLLVGALGFAALGAAKGSDHTPAASAPSASPAPSHSGKSGGSGKKQKASASAPTGPSIDNVKTDPKPLTLLEAFPNAEISLASLQYKQDKTAVNHICAFTARGAMSTALTKQHCSQVVRATYVETTGKYAVTFGVAVFPTKAAAMAAAMAGDPSSYQWFRGMRSKHAKNIDSAGGYAASTVLGRYLIYSYAQNADGSGAKAGDTALKSLATAALDSAEHPIRVRAQ